MSHMLRFRAGHQSNDGATTRTPPEWTCTCGHWTLKCNPDTPTEEVFGRFREHLRHLNVDTSQEGLDSDTE